MVCAEVLAVISSLSLLVEKRHTRREKTEFRTTTREQQVDVCAMDSN